jgi:hypothetical protein
MTMIRPSLIALLSVMLLLVSPGAWANTATVLSFTGPTDRAEVPQAFYGQLRAQIEFSANLQLNDVPEQSLGDLLMAIGCAELDASCSEIIRDVLGSDFLAWGEFEELEGGGLQVSMFLWNLIEGRMEREATHAIPEGGEVAVGLAALFSRSILSPVRPGLTVASSTPSTLVFVNDELMGAPPVTLDDLMIGRYLVRLEAPGMAPREELVEVDVNGAQVDWTLEEGAASRVSRAPREPGDSESGSGNGLRYASIGAAGVGTALLVAGIVSGVSSRSTQQDFDDELSQPVFDLARAQHLQDTGESQSRNANLFLGIGAVLAVGGGVGLLVSSMNDSDTVGDSESAERDRQTRRVRWAVAPGWNHGPAAAGMIRF